MQLESLDVLGPKIATVCGAAAGSVGAALAMAGEVAMQVLGVPLPVVMGSAAGAGIARSLMDPVGFVRALFVTAAWTVAGCVGAPLAQVGAQAGLSKLGVEIALTTNVLAGLAALVAALPWWAPKVWPLVQAKFGAKRGGQSGDGGAA